MSPKKENINKIVQKYQQPLVKKIKLLKKQRKLSSLSAKLKGLTPSRLSEFASGKRNFSPFYLWQFLRAGIITIHELLDGKSLSDIPPGDRLLLGLLSLDFKTTNFLINLRDEKGVDLEKLLELFLSAIENDVDVEKLLIKAISEKS